MGVPPGNMTSTTGANEDEDALERLAIQIEVPLPPPRLDALATAMTFYRCGIVAIPIRKGAKKPTVAWRPWQYQATRPTEEATRALWTAHRSDNLAILAGETSRLWIVDADSPEAYAAMAAAFQDAPWVTKTRRGGHFCFHAPDDVPIAHLRNMVHIDLELPNGTTARVDTRGQGGYVIAPGSLHPKGFVYTSPGWPWKPQDRANLPRFNSSWRFTDERGQTRTFAEAMAEHRDREDARNRPAAPRPVPPPLTAADHGNRLSAFERARRYLARCPGAVEGAGGDTYTFQLACKVAIGFELSDADAYSALAAWNQTCQPPWSERALRDKIANARRYGKEIPGGRRDAPAPNVLNERGPSLSTLPPRPLPPRPSHSAPAPPQPKAAPTPAPSGIVPLHFVSVFDFPEEAYKPPPFIVDKLIVSGARVVLGGDMKLTRKTWTLLWLASCVSSGRKFLDFDINTRGPVLYITAEEPRWRVLNRTRKLMRAAGITRAESHGLYIEGDGWPKVRLDCYMFMQQLRAAVHAYKPVMVILEPWRRLHDKNENDSAEVAPILNALTDFSKELGVCIVIAHHLKKGHTGGIESFRGSNDLPSWADCILVSSRKPKSDIVDVEVISRDADVTPFGFELFVTVDEDGDEIATLTRTASTRSADEDERVSKHDTLVYGEIREGEIRNKPHTSHESIRLGLRSKGEATGDKSMRIGKGNILEAVERLERARRVTKANGFYQTIC